MRRVRFAMAWADADCNILSCTIQHVPTTIIITCTTWYKRDTPYHTLYVSTCYAVDYDIA